MTQEERRVYLIRTLLAEDPARFAGLELPEDEQGQRDLLRALLNVRQPCPISQDFLRVQDEYLGQVLREKGVTDLEDLRPVSGNLYLWQGDITLLRADAIVNAANSGMTGCYQPLHSCIDNCIHTFAGVQLRCRCGEIMAEQGRPEPAGRAKITPAYNLPCKYVLHTVGPIVQGELTSRHEELLASCYRSCLELAAENGCESVAFCCISTGVFGYPKAQAARVAVQTVRAWLGDHPGGMKVIFNVFTDEDLAIYRRIL